jgi:PLP dependent protein
MTIAPLVDDPEAVRPVFRGLRELRDRLRDEHGIALGTLSMGMSNDFPVAIAEGATHVRVGRALFHG